MVKLDSIYQASVRLRDVVLRTPLIPYPDTVTPAGRTLLLKAECLQPIGAFKLRGAYNKIATLSPEERQRGVVTYSSGNHAQGVAYAARALGIKACIVMPRNAPAVKVEATRALGAEIVFAGVVNAERKLKAEELAGEHGYAMVPPFEDEQIIAGQGTVGLEIWEDFPQADVVLVPIGGGGLISGVASALKLSGSRAKVVGVEPALANDAQQSLRAGQLVSLPAERVTSTLADGLRAQAVGTLNFEIIRKYVDDIVTVEEDQIREAMRRIALGSRLVAEPSGAVAAAALMFNESSLPGGSNVVAIVSGGNVEPSLLAEVLDGRH